MNNIAGTFLQVSIAGASPSAYITNDVSNNISAIDIAKNPVTP